MLNILLRRLAISVPLLIVVTLLTFALSSVAPGDIAQVILGAGGTEAQLQSLREQLGLNQPMLEQYWTWLTGIFVGDMGSSLTTGEPVRQMLLTRVPVTVSIMLGTLLVTLIVGVALGIASAQFKGRLRTVVDGLSMVGLMVPPFVVALVLVIIFAVQLRWLPAGGYTPLTTDPGGWLMSLVLPVAAVSFMSVTAVAKQTREAMESSLASLYAVSLYASGVPRWRVILVHGLRNSAGSILTVAGLMMITAVTNTVFVEKVFVLPGVGGLAVEAASQHNLPVLQGTALVFALITIAVNLLVDVTHGASDPRVRSS